MVLVGIGTGELSPFHDWWAPSLLNAFCAPEDTAKDREYIVRKILSTRLFDGPSPGASAELAEDDVLKERQKSLAWRASVKDIEGEVLCGAFSQTHGTSFPC